MSDSNQSGAPVHVLSLIKGLKKFFDFKVIAPNGWLVSELELLHIEVFVVPINLFSFFKIRKYYRNFQKNNLIIHCHGVKAGGIGRIAALGLRKRLVYTEHNWTKDYHLNQEIRKPFQLLALQILSIFTDRIICVSKAVMNFYLQKKLASLDKLTIIYNGVQIHNIKQKVNNPDEVVLGMIASLVKRKAVDLLITALYRLKNLVGLKLKLLIVGEGEEKEDLKKLVHEYHLDKSILWLGNICDVKNFLSKIDIYVQTSLDESFGIALAEALLAGIPVVASRVGAIPELVTDKNSLFRKGDVNDLMLKLKECIVNLENRKYRAYSQKEFLQRKFSEEVMVRNYKEFYNNIKF